MKKPVLVIVKPDGMSKNLYGQVLERFGDSGLELIGMRLIQTTRDKVEEHYSNIKDQPFYQKQVKFFLGDTNGQTKLMFFVYYGDDAVQVGRDIAGSTNPEDAAPQSIRGRYGRITTKDIYENVIHVSSDNNEAEREIKLWLNPEDVLVDIYSSTDGDGSLGRRVWS